MYTFWEVVWLFFWGFAFVAYLTVLFSIVSDIFRDHTLNGWLKALWIIFLVFLPFITALVYLIARGTGMAERTQERVERNHASAEQYIRSVTTNGGTASPSEEIGRAKTLLEDGTITEAEFAQLKSRALAHTA